MHIERLELFQFRNIARANIVPEATTIALVGGNGHGKTNLLEAIYLCATGRSFRNSPVGQLIAQHAPHAFVRATVSRRAVQHVVEVRLLPQERSLIVDERLLRHAATLLELLNVVAFFPDDLRIVKGSPEHRRRFLDRTAAAGRPEFVHAALAYHKLLKSRNALLRNQARPDAALLSVYDDQLAQHGAVIQNCRSVTLDELRPPAQRRFESILGLPSSANFRVELTSGLPTDSVACAYADAFREALKRSFPVDRARRMTTVGPHRVDLRLFFDGLDARQYASQGQQRALVLALKMAEIEAVTARIGMSPILLLDDVSSELDAQRTQMLFDAIATLRIQTWVTTTGATLIPWPPGTCFFNVHEGTITQSAKSSDAAPNKALSPRPTH